MYDYTNWPLQEQQSDASTGMNQCAVGPWCARSPTPGLHGRSGCGVTCQVEGCVADLSLEEKAYCMKKRICSEHMRAECIVRPGDNKQLWRFCFQCGKLEPLSNFDGTNRSCRARLERRKLPPRRCMSWSAGSRNTNSCSTSAQTPQAQQQQMMLMLDIHQQQALLEKLQQQMLLMQQQQPQLQTCSMMDTGLPVNLVSASPEAMALLQQQQMLLEQKRLQLQMLRSAMAQTGLQVPTLSPTGSGPTTPSVLAPVRISLEGLMHSHVSPAASLAAATSEPLAPIAVAAAAASGPQPVACTGFMMSGGQAQVQMQPQGVATGAAAAAALAGSSNWPFIGAASGIGGSAAGSQISGDNTPAEVEMMDEFDPLTAEFAAAFPDLDLGTFDMMAAQQAAPAQQQQQQWQQDGQLSASMEAAVAAFSRPATPLAHNNLAYPASQMPMQTGGFLQTGSNQQLSVGLQMPLVPQMDSQQHIQLQALMQSVHSLQETVRELSVRVAGQGGSP